MNRRVVITGIGVVAPGKVGMKPFWDLLTAGRTATRLITLFDPTPFRSRMAAEVDFDPEQEGLAHQEIERLDRAAQFATVAAREALADSGFDVEPPLAHRTGVSIGSAVGLTQRLEQEYVAISDGGAQWLVDHTCGSPPPL